MSASGFSKSSAGIHEGAKRAGDRVID
jgi:hypothetical protein